MLSIPNPQALLVDAFMVASGYNDTNHPAVRLIDLYLTEHPQTVTYITTCSKYVALWVLLNVLTAIFAVYLVAKVAVWALRTVCFGLPGFY